MIQIICLKFYKERERKNIAMVERMFRSMLVDVGGGRGGLVLYVF